MIAARVSGARTGDKSVSDGESGEGEGVRDSQLRFLVSP
jgi:hypothetical protein